MLSYVVLAVLLLVGVAVFLRRPIQLLALAVFFLPWKALSLDLGARVSFYRVILLTMACVAVLHLVVRRNTCRERLKPHLARSLPLFAYVFGLAVIQLPWLPKLQIVGGPLRAPAIRALLEPAWFFLLLSPALLLPIWVTMPRVLSRLSRTYLLSLLILSLIGWVQLGVWLASGSNILPLDLLLSVRASSLGAAHSLRAGVVHFRGTAILRMNSLAGEPKYFGQSLALGLILLQVGWDEALRARKTRVRTLGLWFLFFLTMLATLSTSGFYLWLLGTATYLVLRLTPYLSRSLPHRRKLASIGAPAVLIGVGVLFVFLYNPTLRHTLTALARMRTVSRSPLEDFDQAIFRFLRHSPKRALVGTGVGNANLYAMPYLPPFARAYAQNTAFAAKIGILRIVSETGILGLLIFVGWHIKESKALARHALLSPKSAIVLVLATSTFLMLLARTEMLPYYAWCLGGVAALQSTPTTSSPRASSTPPMTDRW